MRFELEGMTLAVNRMDAMVEFFESVFGVEFQTQEMHGHRLFAGNWGTLKLLLCPAELARNTASQNRHQFDLLVEDLDQALGLIKNNGGTLMGEVQIDDGCKSFGCYDPDGNSIVFKQLL